VLARRIAGITVGSMGAGDVSLATAASRGIDSREVEGALSEVLSLGVTLVDVAPEADSEALVGGAVRALRLRDTVAVAMRVPPRTGSMTSAYLVERVEASLRASKLDAIPLALLPLRADWRTSTAWPELVGTAARLVYDGKVLAWGAEADDAATARELMSEPWLVAFALPFNLCDRGAAELFTAPPPPPPPSADVVTPSGLILPTFDLNLPLDIAIALATSPPAPSSPPPTEPVAPVDPTTLPLVLARRPLAGGTLVGTMGPGMRRLMRDDRELDDADLARIAVAIARLVPLVRSDPPAARSSIEARTIMDQPRPRRLDAVPTLAELALRYVVSRGAVPLPRLHRREHVAPALTAVARGPLPPSLMEAAIEILT
jgi:aryl-alcohol dehydrogenase-like predicted oxidoreductase